MNLTQLTSDQLSKLKECLYRIRICKDEVAEIQIQLNQI